MRLRRVAILGRKRQLLLLGRALREIDSVLRLHRGDLPTRRAKVPLDYGKWPAVRNRLSPRNSATSPAATDPAT